MYSRYLKLLSHKKLLRWMFMYSRYLKLLSHKKLLRCCLLFVVYPCLCVGKTSIVTALPKRWTWSVRTCPSRAKAVFVYSNRLSSDNFRMLFWSSVVVILWHREVRALEKPRLSPPSVRSPVTRWCVSTLASKPTWWTCSARTCRCRARAVATSGGRTVPSCKQSRCGSVFASSCVLFVRLLY